MSAPSPEASGDPAFSNSGGDRRRRAAISLRVEKPVAARPADVDAISASDYTIDLDVLDVRPYDHNPRCAPNPQYEQIKTSISRIGLRSPLCVTRRPGDSHYIIEAGGNSRLLALQALYQETASPAFRYVRALYRPWRGESHVLSAHLIENDTRGALTYWDRAQALMRLREQLQSEEHIALSLADLQARLDLRGYAVSKAALGFYAFAVERLSALGDRCVLLTSDAVKCLQHGINRLRRHAEDHHGLDESTFFDEVIDPVLRRVAQAPSEARRIDPIALLDQCAGDLAHMVCRPAAQVRAVALEDSTSIASDRRQAQDPSERSDAASQPVTLWRCPRPLLAPIEAYARAAGLSLQHQADLDPAAHPQFVPVSTSQPSIDRNASYEMSARALRLLLDRCTSEPKDADAHDRLDSDLLGWLLDPDEAAADEFLKALRLIRAASAAPPAADIPPIASHP